MYYYKNELEIKDLNNNEKHKIKFDCIKELYDGELFIIDTRELGFEIITDIENIYNEKPISTHTIESEIENYLLDVTNKIRDRIRKVSYENNIEIEKEF